MVWPTHVCTRHTKGHQVVVLTLTLTLQQLRDHQHHQVIHTHVHHVQTIHRQLNVAAQEDQVATHTKALCQPEADQADILTALQDPDQLEHVSILSVHKLDVSLWWLFELLNVRPTKKLQIFYVVDCQQNLTTLITNKTLSQNCFCTSAIVKSTWVVHLMNSFLTQTVYKRCDVEDSKWFANKMDLFFQQIRWKFVSWRVSTWHGIGSLSNCMMSMCWDWWNLREKIGLLKWKIQWKFKNRKIKCLCDFFLKLMRKIIYSLHTSMTMTTTPLHTAIRCVKCFKEVGKHYLIYFHVFRHQFVFQSLIQE